MQLHLHSFFSLALLYSNSVVKYVVKSSCIDTELNVATLIWLLNWCFLHSDYDGNHCISYASFAYSRAEKGMRYWSVCSSVFQITGALQPLEASAHHIQSNRAEVYAGMVASQVLVGLHYPAPLAEVSSSLKGIVKHVYEVIDTEVQG